MVSKSVGRCLQAVEENLFVKSEILNDGEEIPTHEPGSEQSLAGHHEERRQRKEEDR